MNVCCVLNNITCVLSIFFAVNDNENLCCYGLYANDVGSIDNHLALINFFKCNVHILNCHRDILGIRTLWGCPCYKDILVMRTL